MGGSFTQSWNFRPRHGTHNQAQIKGQKGQRIWTGEMDAMLTRKYLVLRRSSRMSWEKFGL
jgi:hypothetical protein